MTSITLKWGKKAFSMTCEQSETGSGFKQKVQDLTGVPTGRQKLLSKQLWKGTLKDDFLFTSFQSSSPLTITLIGSAEELVAPKSRTKFLEDLTAEELQSAKEKEEQLALSKAEGMISALQFPPHQRDDEKQEVYHYNRLVTGLPQRQIEKELKDGQRESNNFSLRGKVAMTFGLELKRAYVNGLTALRDGTCVSVHDDGHVQLWKNATQLHDRVLPPGDGGVDSVVALDSDTRSSISFATAGRGRIQLWNDDGEMMAAVPNGLPGTTPDSLTGIVHMNEGGTRKNIVGLAARFKITRQVDELQFRLAPQNSIERERRAMAESQEQAIQHTLSAASRSIIVWSFKGGDSETESAASNQFLQTQVLDPPSGLEGSAPITCLCNLAASDYSILVVGDDSGGLRIWDVDFDKEGGLQFSHFCLYQIRDNNSSIPCVIICMENMENGHLAISTDLSDAARPFGLSDAIPINVSLSRGVHIFGFQDNKLATPKIVVSMAGHIRDNVICMCSLPNGDLLTGGGKLDATLQLWSKHQLKCGHGEEMTELPRVVSEASKTLTDVGYVFALTLLPDCKHGSHYYAVAAARYNVVKVII